ncbi:MAG: DUF1800 domain-containing protein [Verrucomicrobia bacterium]|nr:DUF1800 domain-containing protein [Verrucomicrobiota bacterium]
MKPSPAFVALNRATFGATPEELSRMEKMGWSTWVEEQLKPGKEDAEADKRIASQKLHIKYEHEGSIDPRMMKPGGKMSMMAEGKSMMMAAAPAPDAEAVKAKEQPKKTFKIDEKRGLTLLDMPLEQLFQVQNREEYPYEERERASLEVETATILRACYSKWQVREMLVDFWHNHFNIDIDSDDTIRAVWPAYDRDVIRKHALGNFREMVQAVGQSLPMLYYLNNRSSRASPANENYARELFELHTLGAEHYLNHLYAKWREVPGALEGKAEGYIDQDVYEAARAFTGWTAADGEEEDENDRFPATGGFYYYDKWHDPYQKRVLGIELEPNQPALADGMAVLDIAAFHPGTAIYLSRKLCRRFIADEPTEALVKRIAEVWTSHAKSPDQMVHVMREILLSPEINTGFGQKTKRPFEFLASFIRASGADFRQNEDIGYDLGDCGQRLFSWGPPTGHPDTADYWQSPNSLLKRWKFVRDLATDGYEGEVIRMNLIRHTPEDKRTWQAIADHWMDQMAPSLLSENTRDELSKWFRQYEDDDKPQWHDPDADIALNESDLAEHLGEFISLIAATPEFQLR